MNIAQRDVPPHVFLSYHPHALTGARPRHPFPHPMRSRGEPCPGVAVGLPLRPGGAGGDERGRGLGVPVQATGQPMPSG